jgi:hypothetical protein
MKALFPSCSFGVPVEKKNRKQGKHRQSARHGARTVHAKRRESVKKKKVERASPPWLQVLSTGIEDDLRTDVSRELFSRRNGGRRPRNLDLYIPEDNSKSR